MAERETGGMARPLPEGPELEQARRMWRAMEQFRQEWETAVADGAATEKCSCAGYAWTQCSECGDVGWLIHACPGGCDDVTCEDWYLCNACTGASPCAVHNGAEMEYADDL